VSPERRLQILGAECVAEIHRIVDQAPPPSPEVVEEIRQIFAPAVERYYRRHGTKQKQVAAA
jgi:hypothetical protein